MSSQIVGRLQNEHDQIRAILSAFETYLDEALARTSEKHDDMATLMDWLTESLFLLHEEKEETVLLPELSRKGWSWSDGTVAHVRQAHRHCRYLLRSLRHASREKRAWSSEQRRHVLSIGREWIQFNRQHLALEEAHVFPFLASSLSEFEDQKIIEQFLRIDEEYMKMADATQMEEARAAFLSKYGRPS